MATKPILQAELALADLAEHFEHWRRSRATVQERIPQPLWDQAVVLTTVLPGSQVAKRLRLSPTDLKKQCLARHRRPHPLLGVPTGDSLPHPIKSGCRGRNTPSARFRGVGLHTHPLIARTRSRQNALAAQERSSRRTGLWGWPGGPHTGTTRALQWLNDIKS